MVARSEWDTASEWSKWTFCVANQMMNIGLSKTLEYDDLMRLPKDFRSAPLVHQFGEVYSTTKKWFIYPRLMMSLFKQHKFRLVIVFLLAIIKGALRIVSMVILRYFLRSLISSNGGEAFMWVGILAGLNVVTFICHGMLYYSTMKLGAMWKLTSIGYIYQQLFSLKSNHLHSGVIGGLGTGKLVNLISNDVARFDDFAVFSPFCYVSVLEVCGILVILSFYLNIASAFAGVGTTVLLLPLQIYFGGVYSRIRTRTAAATDQRVRYIAEVIEGMSTVKAYGWEVPFFSAISKIRQTELAEVQKSQHVKAINLGLYCFGPSVATFATFAVFWRSGGLLDIPLVFSTISMLLLLRETIGRNFSRGIETTSEAFSACQRIEQFLNVTEEEEEEEEMLTTDACSAIRKLDSIEANARLIDIKDANFTYSGGNNFSIKNIQLTLRAGELIMVVGSVGSGKSTLLSALLGELPMELIGDESVKSASAISCRCINNLRFSFCAQKPWIVAATVKSNIVLAGQQHPLQQELCDSDSDSDSDLIKEDGFKCPSFIDQDLYNTAIKCCRIQTDMNLWPHGDLTEIGERGMSVSGGQKARIALARAVYANSDVYILDDVLSAVDAHVGRALFFDCIVGTLRNKGKGVVLATHQVQYLKYADKVLVIEPNGQQSFFGTYEELYSRKSEFASLGLPSSSTDESTAPTNLTESVVVPQTGPTGEAASAAPVGRDEVQQLTEDPEYHDDRDPNSKTKADDGHEVDSLPISRKSIEPNASMKQLGGVQAEKSAAGQVSSRLWLNYLASGGVINGSVATGVAVLSQAFLMMSDYWLKWWAAEAFGAQSNIRYLWIYSILTGCSVIFGIWRALAWFKFTINASKQLHDNSLWALFHTQMSFFVANPSGRVLNRFSRDQSSVDENLPYTLYDCVENGILFLVATVVLVCVSIPWLTLMVPVLLYIFNTARLKYVASSREIRRIEATLRSPVYSDFSATLEGLVTLRAYNLQSRATKAFFIELDCCTRPWFNFMMTSRWLSFRLDGICLIIILGLCVIGAALRHTIDVGLIGFALTYSMAITTLLQWTVRQLAETENLMTSVERIAEYGLLPPEYGYRVTHEEYKSNHGEHRERSESETKVSLLQYHAASTEDCGIKDGDVPGLRGTLELRDLTVAYREDFDPVISNLSVIIPAGAKVGICGRTGSGKSSTLLAILRLNVIKGGDMILDGKSLLETHLETARSHLTVIPQEPHLFSGTVRFNVDPFSIYSDSEIWSALGDSCIRPYIESDGKGLDMEVEEGGKNFSVGQRQLLSLARAILRRCPVVLMDEVTASIDYETDRKIQQIVRESAALRSSSIITVAHRLRTIADSDMIIVVEAGRLKEVGSPAKLLHQPDSVFRALAEESNEWDEICRLATRDEIVESQPL